MFSIKTLKDYYIKMGSTSQHRVHINNSVLPKNHAITAGQFDSQPSIFADHEQVHPSAAVPATEARPALGLVEVCLRLHEVLRPH